MKIITFIGGLGNQIFQYSYYLYLKKEFPQETFYAFYPKRGLNRHNGFELDKWFDVDLPKTTFVSNTIANILFWSGKVFTRLKMATPFLNTDEYTSSCPLLYLGYWQDKKYVSLSALSFKNNLDIDENNLKFLNLIDASNSVAVHVRRGDYTDSKMQYIYGNIGTLDYYENAIKIIKKKVQNPKFFFFSDDVTYVRNNFHEENMEIVNCNKGEKSFFDMYLMSHCKSMIITNSTFSCWAAYLNKNQPLVICPKKWRNDIPSPSLALDDWTQI